MTPRVSSSTFVMGVCLMLACSVVASAQTPPHAANLTRGCVERFDPATDYFPDKAAIEDAANFAVSYHRSFKVVTVKGGAPAGTAERYVLLQCGAPVPRLDAALADAQIVSIPLTSLFVTSTTHLSLLVDLDRIDVLTGVPRLDMATSAALETRVEAGQVTEFARVGRVIDVERVVAARPSMLMASGGTNPTLSAVRNAGVPVVTNTEWLESAALARAEWLKYIALFLNEERQAQSFYSAMKGRYRSLSRLATARSDAERPLVMTGRSSRGVFTIAGGRSYVAALIADAGGRYAWTDNTAAGSAQVDLEAQIRRAADADIWINGGGWPSLAAMLEDEPRYAAFKAWRQGQVWVYERRLTPDGENDYWSRGLTRPDLVLADLVKVFHPTLVPAHAFEWYMPVPAR
jgi:iron complex transport system substrate-binding protein